jgi:hypothetical protein
VKLIKSLDQIIKESVGVPIGIIETSQKLLDSFMIMLEGIIEEDRNAREYDSTIIDISGPFFISDMKIDEIKITLNIIPHDSITLARMYVGKTPSVSLPHVIFKDLDDIRITIEITAEKNTTGGEILEYIKKNKSKIISSLSHELMHEYSFFKKPKTRIEKFVEYNASQKSIGTIRAVNNFLFAHYFLHEFENEVRPTEVYSYLKSKNTTKQSFLSDLKENKVIVELDSLKKLTYESFVEELKDSYSTIHHILSSNDYEIEGYSKNEVIEMFLFVLRKLMINWRIDLAQNTIEDPFDHFVGFFRFAESKAVKLFTKFLDKISSGGKLLEDEFDEIQSPKNNKIFFTKQINNIRNTSNLIYKKLGKLYSILPDENENKNTLNKKISSKIR